MDEGRTIAASMGQVSGNNIASVIQQFGKRLMGFIRRRVSSEADAEDVLQDVWYQLTRTVDTEPIEQVSSWLFKVARNKITDRYRKKQPASLENYQQEGEEEDLSFSAILADNAPDPEMEYLHTLFWNTLDEALLELPEEQRNVFIWHELEGRSFREISESTGEKLNTLLSRKRYAVLYLRERLQELYQEIINP